MKIFILICMVVACIGDYVDKDGNDLKMIVDFIKHFQRPTVIDAKVNWELHKKADLVSHLSKAEKSTLIRYLDKQDVSVSKDAVSSDNLFLVDLRCPDIKTFLKQANSSEKFILPNKWLFLNEFRNASEIVPKELYNMNILFNSEVTLAQYDGNDSYNLQFIYKKSTSRWYSELFGNWSKTVGLQVALEMLDSTTFMRRKNFEKIPIPTTFVINDESTKTDLSNLRHNPVDAVTVSGFRQTVHLFDFINATRTVVFTDTWGYLINGSWNGMMGNLVNREAEFGGTVIFINKQRIDLLEYLIQPINTVIRFVFRRPPLSYQNNLLLLPFRANVWICIGGFVVVYIAMIYLSSRWEFWKMKKGNKENTADVTLLLPNLGDVTLFVISAITQQGSHSELKGVLGRIVMLILFLVFLFIYTSYSACIVALLQSSSNNIRTLSDLLNSRLELGVEETPYNRYYFSTATEPIRKAIYDTKVAPKGSKANFMSLEEGVKKIQKEPFAFHMNCASGYRLMMNFFFEHEKCGLQEVSFIANSKPWFACRKASPYKEIFKIGVRRLHENGILARENDLVYSKKPECFSAQGSFASVSIRDCYMAFLVLLYGIVLSIAIMVLEILMHSRR